MNLLSPIFERIAALRARRAPRATIDFETRSPAEIRNGSWLYARNPNTRILCLAFKLPGDTEVSLWVPPMASEFDGDYEAKVEFARSQSRGRPIEDLFRWIREGGLVEAHNVMFERCIWTHIATRPLQHDANGASGLGAPPLREEQLRCSAAKAAAYALPRNLGEAGRALGLSRLKDDEGGKTMLKLSKPRPRRGRKSEDPSSPLHYYELDLADEVRVGEFTRMYSYCCDDVEAEHALSEALPDLSDFEQKVWLADMRANWRGVRVDVALCHAAIEMDARVKAAMNKRLEVITTCQEYPDGVRGTERAKLIRWLGLYHNVWELTDSTADTLDWYMDTPMFAALSDEAREVVRIARDINRTSVTKYRRILACVDTDGRVRELVMYHGAATGRWSGKGIQVQNFPRGVLFDLTGANPKHTPMDKLLAQAVEDIKSGNVSWCQAVYGDILALLSSTLRGCLIPGEGRVFYVADYSAIEARVVLWLAAADEALQVFYRGEDIYCAMASTLYRRKITKADKDERQFGKVTILGLGYGMGFLTFLLNLRSYKLKFTPQQAWDVLGEDRDKYIKWVKDRLWPKAPTGVVSDEQRKRFATAKRQAAADKRRLREAREDPEGIIHELALCKYVVDTYRKAYPEVKKLWYEQEDAAVAAVQGYTKARREAEASGVEWDRVGPKVPCGKVVWWVEERYLFCALPSGRRLVYVDPFIHWENTPWGERRAELRFYGVHKKMKRWARMSTYGGSIVENIDQATARDMMAVAFVALDESDDYDPIASIHDELLAEADIGTGDPAEYERLMITLPEWASGCPVASEGGILNRYQK